jgi:hypothetical protein
MAKPAGLIVYHNTLIAEHSDRDPHSNVHFRNNLLLGTDHPARGIATFANATPYSTYDYDGYRPNRNGRPQYTWLGGGYTPAPGDWRSFPSLAALAAATGQETHGVEVDYDIFERVTPPDPATRHAVYYSADFDFRLKPGARAVDAGVALPNINDGFTGRAPDLGALEQGQPLPVYGPRIPVKQPFYR